MKPVVVLEFETGESLRCFVENRKLNVVEEGNRIAVVSSENPSELAVKLRSEIGPSNVRLAFQFKDLKSIFKEHLTASEINGPIDFKVINMNNEDQLKLYYQLVEEAIASLPGIEISEVEPKEIFTVFVGKSFYVEIWESPGIGGSACIKGLKIGVLFTGSQDSFNIALNILKSGYGVKLFCPFTNESSLRNIIYQAWRLAKLGEVTLVAYREIGGPSINGLAELLSKSSSLNTIVIPCNTISKIGALSTIRTLQKVGMAPFILGCYNEIRLHNLQDININKFNEEITLTEKGHGKMVSVEINADPSSLGMHNMLDNIIPQLLRQI